MAGMWALKTFAPEIRECCVYVRNKSRTMLSNRQLVRTIRDFVSTDSSAYEPVGARRMEEMKAIIGRLPGYSLSYFQRMAFDAMLRCVAPAVFFDCGPDELAVYFKKNRWEPMHQRMMFMQTSRRMGKTDIMTITAALLLYIVPNNPMLAWSLFNDTSAEFGKTVVRWLEDMGCASNRILHNDKRVLVMGTGPHDERLLTLLGAQNANVSFFFAL